MASFGAWLSANAERASRALSVRKRVSGRWFEVAIQKAPCALLESSCHGLEGISVWTGSFSEDFSTGGLAGRTGAAEEGVLAVVGIEDSASPACVEDPGGDAAGCVEALADGRPVLFAWDWHSDGRALLHDGCRGPGEGAVSRMHGEIEGACAAEFRSLIEEASSACGEDGSGSVPSGSRGSLRNPGRRAMESSGRQRTAWSSCWVHRRVMGLLCTLLGEGGIGRRFGSVSRSRFIFTPRGLRPESFEACAGQVFLCGVHGLSGGDEFAQEIDDGFAAHSSGVADLAEGGGHSGIGRDGPSALARVLCVRRGGTSVQRSAGDPLAGLRS